MSSIAIDDAEKVIPEQYPVSIALPVVHSTPSVRAVDTLASLPSIEVLSSAKPLEKATPQPRRATTKIPLSIAPKKPGPRRAGRRVRLLLWFNSYRYESLIY